MNPSHTCMQPLLSDHSGTKTSVKGGQIFLTLQTDFLFFLPVIELFSMEALKDHAWNVLFPPFPCENKLNLIVLSI